LGSPTGRRSARLPATPGRCSSTPTTSPTRAPSCLRTFGLRLTYSIR